MRQWAARKGQCLIFDPISKRWDSHDTYNDIDTYIAQAKKVRSHLLVIDESGTSLSRYDSQHAWLATQSRHYGHSTIFITQRANLLPPVIRNQCNKIFMFSTSIDDIETIANEFNCPTIISEERLQQFEFWSIGRFSPPVRLYVNPANGRYYLHGQGKKQPTTDESV